MILEYQAGKSSRDLSKTYDLPRSSILAILKREGVARPRERISQDQIHRACRLIATGMPVALVAEEIKIAKRTLYYQLRARDLPTRPT